MKSDLFSVEDLVARYPDWEKHIRQGDFRVSLSKDLSPVVEWPNTSIFAPFFSDIQRVISLEFTQTEKDHIKVHASINSLIISVVSKKAA